MLFYLSCCSLKIAFQILPCRGQCFVLSGTPFFGLGHLISSAHVANPHPLLTNVASRVTRDCASVCGDMACIFRTSCSVVLVSAFLFLSQNPESFSPLNHCQHRIDILCTPGSLSNTQSFLRSRLIPPRLIPPLPSSVFVLLIAIFYSFLDSTCPLLQLPHPGGPPQHCRALWPSAAAHPQAALETRALDQRHRFRPPDHAPGAGFRGPLP